MKIFPLCLRTSKARGTMRVRPAGFLMISVLSIAFQSAHAQIGSNNPTGPAGTFNGQITTGCSYDPVTGNAMRSVTDLVVAGGVGAYPLAFTRTANSRQSLSGTFQFGADGAWKHSYSWSISGGESSSASNFAPSYYSVSFPDGGP